MKYETEKTIQTNHVVTDLKDADYVAIQINGHNYLVISYSIKHQGFLLKRARPGDRWDKEPFLILRRDHLENSAFVENNTYTSIVIPQPFMKEVKKRLRDLPIMLGDF